MILMLKAKQMFLKCFHDNTIIINIIVILALGREFFSAKCSQFALTFMEGI